MGNQITSVSQNYLNPNSYFIIIEQWRLILANIKKTKGVIGILTGGGDVPGLNPAIRAVTIRALREGYKVIGLRRGWLGVSSIVRDKGADNSEFYQVLTEEGVNTA